MNKRLTYWLFGIFLMASLVPALSLATATAYFSPEDDLEEVFSQEFQKAQKSIDLAIYNFSSSKIRSDLLDRLQKGVKIRILAHEADKEKAIRFFEPLVSTGAEVRFVTEINHHKFALIDGEVLLNSSGNLSGSSRSKIYDENLVLCRRSCPEHVRAFSREFERLYQYSNIANQPNPTRLSRSEQNTRIHENYPGVALFTSANFTARRGRSSGLPAISFRSHPGEKNKGEVDRYLSQVIDQVYSGGSIQIATGHFRSKPLFDALVRALERNVRIQVVLDGQEYVSYQKSRSQQTKVAKCLQSHPEHFCYRKGYYFSRQLSQAGIDVKLKYYSLRWFYPTAKQMHHKYMIVNQQTVYTGSYNWSNNAEFETFENVMILERRDHPHLVRDYIKNFHQVSQYGGSGGYRSLYHSIQSSRDKVEFHFEPVTLDLNQITRIKDLAYRKCRKLYRIPIEEGECLL